MNTDELTDEWLKFISPDLPEGYIKQLHAGCPEEKLLETEKKLGFPIPEQLRALLKLSNGQRFEKFGLFKNVSGSDVYTRAYFLDADSIVYAWEQITSDRYLAEEFSNEYLPFATEHGREGLGYAFGISLKTGKVYVLWTTHLDMFNPPSWDIWAIRRGDSLVDFLKLQNLMLF